MILINCGFFQQNAFPQRGMEDDFFVIPAYLLIQPAAHQYVERNIFPICFEENLYSVSIIIYISPVSHHRFISSPIVKRVIPLAVVVPVFCKLFLIAAVAICPGIMHPSFLSFDHAVGQGVPGNPSVPNGNERRSEQIDQRIAVILFCMQPDIYTLRIAAHIVFIIVEALRKPNIRYVRIVVSLIDDFPESDLVVPTAIQQ